MDPKKDDVREVPFMNKSTDVQATSTTVKPHWDFTINIQGILATILFLGTLAGAWYNVTSNARDLATIVDQRYIQYIENQKTAAESRAELLLSIKESNDLIRQDIRDLKREVQGNGRGIRDDRSSNNANLQRSTTNKQPTQLPEVYLGSRGGVERP